MTREKILHAAFEEFYRNGFQAGSLNHIVEAAGATKGALFHHFESKNELGYAVVDEIIRPVLTARWAEPMMKSTDPIADLKRLLAKVAEEEMCRMLEQGCPLNNLAQEMSPLDEGFRKRIEGIYTAWRQCLEAAFERGIKAGKVRKDVSPKKVAAFFVTAQAGIMGMAKNSQSTQLVKQVGEGLCDYLDSLKP